MDKRKELQFMSSKQAAEDVNSEAHPIITKMSSGSGTGNDCIKDGLQLSIGLYTPGNQKQQQQADQRTSPEPYLRLGSDSNPIEKEEEDKVPTAEPVYGADCGGTKLLKQQAKEQLRLATIEKAYAQHAREWSKRQVELAEAEFAHAKRIREEAQVELNRAQLLNQQASRRIDATCMEITCHACRQHNQNHVTKMAGPELNAETCLSLQLRVPLPNDSQQQQHHLPFNPTVSSSVSSEISNSTSKQELN